MAKAVVGVSYGCPCGQHIGHAPDVEQAIAAVRACPGPPAAPERRPRVTPAEARAMLAEQAARRRR